MKQTILACTLLLICALSGTADIWNLKELSQSPKFKWVDDTSPIRSLIYEGEEVDGKPTDVFAFYGSPALAKGGEKKEYPAVVLIHGGGGTAFAEWVELWVDRGYAAIAMDLAGKKPAEPTFEEKGRYKKVSHRGVKPTRLPAPGPDQGHTQKFKSISGPEQTHWPLHAVGNVIRAHSLIRSFEEVDENRTAVTGISWGGYTTCIVASVDDRFKAAVPVYGCGFLYEGESVQKPSIDALEPADWKRWVERYDPSSHLGRCIVSIFFVNGTNDKHYPLDSYMRSYSLPKGERQLRIEPMMRHSHQAGWEPKEIGLFIDSKLKGSAALPKIHPPTSTKGTATFPIDAKTGLTKAEMHFTTDTGLMVKRKWKTEPATIEGNAIKSSAPDTKATAWFVTLTDERGGMVSSEVYFPEAE